MSLLLLFGEMHDNIIVVVCVSRQQKCGRLAGGVMVLVAGASHILAASTHTATHGIMGRRFPDGGLLRYRK